MRTTGTKYGCNASGTRSICMKRSAMATIARSPRRKGGARRARSRRKTAMRPPASVPRNTGPAVSAGRSSSVGIRRPRPKPISTHAGTRYTYCLAPTRQAAAKATPSATKRYAPAFGTPSGGRRNAAPMARSTAPPRMPRRGAIGVAARLSVRELVRGEVPRILALEELRVLESGARIEDHDLFVLADPAVTAQLRRCGDRGSALGADEHPFGATGSLHRALDLRFADGDRDPARLAERFEHDEIAQRFRDPDPGSERVRIGPPLRFMSSFHERLDDRGAPLRLRGNEARTLGIEPSDRAQLIERLPHPDETNASAGRVHDHVGQTPAELLRQLEPHRLLALDAIRLP